MTLQSSQCSSSSSRPPTSESLYWTVHCPSSGRVQSISRWPLWLHLQHTHRLSDVPTGLVHSAQENFYFLVSPSSASDVFNSSSLILLSHIGLLTLRQSARSNPPAQAPWLHDWPLLNTRCCSGLLTLSTWNLSTFFISTPCHVSVPLGSPSFTHKGSVSSCCLLSVQFTGSSANITVQGDSCRTSSVSPSISTIRVSVLMLDAVPLHLVLLSHLQDNTPLPQCSHTCPFQCSAPTQTLYTCSCRHCSSSLMTLNKNIMI